MILRSNHAAAGKQQDSTERDDAVLSGATLSTTSEIHELWSLVKSNTRCIQGN